MLSQEKSQRSAEGEGPEDGCEKNTNDVEGERHRELSYICLLICSVFTLSTWWWLKPKISELLYSDQSKRGVYHVDLLGINGSGTGKLAYNDGSSIDYILREMKAQNLSHEAGKCYFRKRFFQNSTYKGKTFCLF